MITGYNTEIKVGAKVYHIQTEDKGEKNPVIETLIYVGGEIIDAYRTSYSEILKTGLDKEKLRIMMQQQHNKVIAFIRQGKYISEDERNKPEKTPSNIEVKLPANEVKSIKDNNSLDVIEKQLSSKTLDQIILEYLEKHSEEEKLLLEIVGDDTLVEGNPTSLIIRSINESNNQLVPKAKIIVKIISTTKKPIIVFDGFSNEKGELNIDFVVPEFPGGNAAIIIQGFSNIGDYEIKRLIIKPSKKS